MNVDRVAHRRRILRPAYAKSAHQTVRLASMINCAPSACRHLCCRTVHAVINAVRVSTNHKTTAVSHACVHVRFARQRPCVVDVLKVRSCSMMAVLASVPKARGQRTENVWCVVSNARDARRQVSALNVRRLICYMKEVAFVIARSTSFRIR